MCVCAQYVPSVHMKEIQAATIKVLNSKIREKIEKQKTRLLNHNHTEPVAEAECMTPRGKALPE